MPVLNIAKNLKVGTMQVLRVMHRLEQVWPPEALCLTFSDDFERLTLGPDWVDGPVFAMGSYTVVLENAIDSGAYVAGENDEPAPVAVMGSIRTAAEFLGDQFVETTVGNFFQGHDPCMAEYFQIVEGEMWLLTQVQPDSNACIGAYVIIQVGSSGSEEGYCYMQLMTVDAAGVRSYFDDGSFFPLPAWRDNPDYLLRFESTAEGHCRAFFEGNLVVEGDVIPVGGPHVGLAQQWNRTNYGGLPLLFEDDFDRANGALGPDWTVAAAGPSHGPLVIVDGAAVAQAVTSSWGYHSFYIEPVTGDYAVEIDIRAMGGELGGANQLVSILVSFDIATFTGLEWSFVISSSSPGDGNLRRNTWVNGVQDTTQVQDHIDNPVILRVEKVGDHYRFMYLAVGATEYGTADASDWPEFAAGDHIGMRSEWDDRSSGPPHPLAPPSIDGFSVRGIDACEIWRDDFARADGPVGPNWVLGLETGTGEAPQLPVISSGAAVGPELVGAAPHEVGTMSWATPIDSPNQYVEITFDNWYRTVTSTSWYEIYNFGGGGVAHSEARRAAEFQFSYSAGIPRVTINAYSYLDDGGTSEGDYTEYYPWEGSTGEMIFRLESWASGRQVVALNGEVLLDYVETETPFAGLGQSQGVWMYFDVFDGTAPPPRLLSISGGDPDPQHVNNGTSPRFEMVTGGQDCGAPEPACWVCDDFERADGPIGSDWIPHPAAGAGETMTIESGAAVAPLDLLSSLVYWHEDFTGSEQAIEIEVENAMGNFGWFTIHANLDGTTYTSYQVEIDFHDNESELWLSLNRFDPTSGSVTLDIAGPLAYPASEPIRFGLISEVGGRQVVTMNGVVQIDVTDPDPLVGPYVGMEMDPHSPQTSPRILDACIGTCPPPIP